MNPSLISFSSLIKSQHSHPHSHALSFQFLHYSNGSSVFSPLHLMGFPISTFSQHTPYLQNHNARCHCFHKKTHQVLNLNHHHQEQKQQQQQETSSSSSPLSLQLHSRASLEKPTHSDYKSLTLSRLERDSARVTSLLTPQKAKLEGPIISGTSEGSGEYFSQIGIGDPPIPSYMILDTGSDITWFQCVPCHRCYHQRHPIFDPSSSSSYAPLSCDTPQCKSLDQSQCRTNDTCLYQVSYGDGSYTVCDFVTETVTVGSSSVESIAIGCGHNNQGLLVGAAGLFGLGGGSLSFPAQLNATSFSYCLVDRDSDESSTLDFDSPFPVNSITAPLRRNPEFYMFYYVGVVGIGVGGELLPIPESSFEMDLAGNGGIIVDSGTAVTRLQSDVYNLLRDAFVRGTQGLPVANGVSLFETCYDLSSMRSVEVPTVSFHFPEGKVLVLPAKNYLIPVDSVGTFCFAFAPTMSTLSIIGNVQQQGTRVSFDLANSLVAFSANSC